MSDAIRTSQDDINAGAIPFEELFYRGAHLFSNRFTSQDHYGEAPDGPRQSEQSLASNPHTPFLRFNGLDAQSCLECHGAIGFQKYDYMFMPRDEGSMGGSAGFASNVFIFEEFENLRNGIVRNPPHTFGLGYVQRLADEMTADLLSIRDQAVSEAATSQAIVDAPLESKGISFGYLTAFPDGSVDTTHADGVSSDLVVRPFQFKGIASSLRNFVSGALNFHFSVQPKELLERGLIENDNPSGMLANDPLYEIEEGEVSAIAAFVAALRPPVQDTTLLDAERVAQGQQIFGEVGCTECHVPSLRIEDPRLTIIDPREVTRRQLDWEDRGYFRSLRAEDFERSPSIVPGDWASEFLAPVIEHEMKSRLEMSGNRRGNRNVEERPAGLTFHLNGINMPAESLPRLPSNRDETIDVPLYSDLKRHNMGEILADNLNQPTDVVYIEVERHEFLTRPLWGVADSGPWLHDGRATTLQDAILMHEGPSSEANEVIQNFKNLDEDEQNQLLEFLFSLRVQPRTVKEPAKAPAFENRRK